VHDKLNMLALETSTGRAAIGLRVRAGNVLTKATDGAQRHGRDLIPRVAELLSEGGLEAREIEVIGVGLGPGSYTGLRVGVTAAKTLAYVTGAALVGLDSLEAVASNAPGTVLRVSVVGDAQRGDVYSAEFTRRASGEPLECTRASQIEPLADWIGRLEPGTLVLGPGLDSAAIRGKVPCELLAADGGMNYPDGRRLLELLHREWAAGRRENVWLLEPRYLRRSAAEDKWESRTNDGAG
jgi:tRNA threonylcarbamoyladenosine biosynthesis protein TsaB